MKIKIILFVGAAIVACGDQAVVGGGSTEQTFEPTSEEAGGTTKLVFPEQVVHVDTSFDLCVREGCPISIEESVDEDVPELAFCPGDLTLVCHVPRGNPDNRHELCVGGAATEAHLKHGDVQGECL